jgi:hypothetical protein
MVLLRALAALALPGAPPAAAAEQATTYLVSIADARIAEGELLEQFTIETWAVDILAICSIPRGWLIRAGQTAAPDGIIEGEATHGVTRLGSERWSDLENLALVRMWGPVRGGSRRTGPGEDIASFFGHADVTDTQGRLRQIPLTLDNLRLTPASRCPDPSG